jgi:hypothetical protein
LRFVGRRPDGKAYVAFWCSHCLRGIALEPRLVPAGYQPVRREDAHIPKYEHVPTTVFEQWLEALQQACDLPPERVVEVVCPNCGVRELQLRFVDRRPDGDARVAFWCNHCLEGIAFERYEVPAAYQQAQDQAAHIPSYRLAPLTLFERWLDAFDLASDLPPERIGEGCVPTVAPGNSNCNS